MATDSKTGQVIYPGAPGVGLRNVGSYQVSGHPYITGSVLYAGEEKRVSFPYVTKNITVINSASANGTVSTRLKIHFASTGSTTLGGANVVANKHYIQFNSLEDSFEFDVKCKEIYISSPEIGGFMLYASLTGIPTSRMYAVTGSGITD